MADDRVDGAGMGDDAGVGEQRVAADVVDVVVGVEHDLGRRRPVGQLVDEALGHLREHHRVHDQRPALLDHQSGVGDARLAVAVDHGRHASASRPPVGGATQPRSWSGQPHRPGP